MKKKLIIIGTCGLLIVIGAVAIGGRDTLRSGARRDWKETAIVGISSRLADPAWASNELAELKMEGAVEASDSDGWLSKRLIVMRNGDWLAYSSICRKENSSIHDLFLGRGSDDQWYYSTYHFCVGMVVLRMEEQSEDLAAFANAYHLRPFDGRSDECLQKTWPPDST